MKGVKCLIEEKDILNSDYLFNYKFSCWICEGWSEHLFELSLSSKHK